MLPLLAILRQNGDIWTVLGAKYFCWRLAIFWRFTIFQNCPNKTSISSKIITKFSQNIHKIITKKIFALATSGYFLERLPIFLAIFGEKMAVFRKKKWQHCLHYSCSSSSSEIYLLTFHGYRGHKNLLVVTSVINNQNR